MYSTLCCNVVRLPPRQIFSKVIVFKWSIDFYGIISLMEGWIEYNNLFDEKLTKSLRRTKHITHYTASAKRKTIFVVVGKFVHGVWSSMTITRSRMSILMCKVSWLFIICVSQVKVNLTLFMFFLIYLADTADKKLAHPRH